MNMRDTLLSRFPAGDKLASVRREVVRAHDTIDALTSKAREISRDEKLTRLGQRDATREHIRTVAPAIATARKALELFGKKISDKRAKLNPKGIADKTDVASAVLRSDMRKMLRDYPMGKRMQIVLAPDADRTMIDAILEAPDALSGIDPETRVLIVERAIERDHPGQLAEIETWKSAEAVLHASVSALVNSTNTVGEFSTTVERDAFLRDAIGEKDDAIGAAVEQYLADVAA